MSKIMLVNVIEGEESRIAILDEGSLDNLYIERAGQEQIVGNIYKARVVAVEQSLQAAFVAFGGERQGFLHVSDIAPVWYHDPDAARRADKQDVPIASALKRGQEILVQVTKEGIRHKAPAVTTYLSIPGRYLVLMPYIKRHGISKKIADEEEREELHKVLADLNPPKNMGIIVRTAAANRSRRDLHRDMNYLLRLWMGIQKQAKTAAAPAVLYEESDLVIRVVRDVFSSEIEKIVVDSKAALRQDPRIHVHDHADEQEAGRALPGSGAALHEVQSRGADRAHPPQPRVAARRRLDRDRADRGARGD